MAKTIWTATIALAFYSMGCEANSKTVNNFKLLEGHGPLAFVSSTVEGDWIVEGDIILAGEPAQVSFLFGMQPSTERYLSLDLCVDRSELVRHVEGQSKILSTYSGAGELPWRVKICKRATYYFFYVNDHYMGFTFRPSLGIPPNRLPARGEQPAVFGSPEALGRIKSPAEPQATQVAVKFLTTGRHELGDVRIEKIKVGERISDPLIVPGPEGSWNDWQSVPGAYLEYEGVHYMYLIGGKLEDLTLEGGGHTVNGLATSSDLYHWNVSDELVLGLGPEGAWDSVLVMVCGAVRTPNGKFAITYMGWNGTTWGGIGLATADHPAGPFTKHPQNPVLRPDTNSWDPLIHVHTLLQENNKYVMLYCGADSNRATWDIIGLATSQDLVTWTKHPANPVFVSEGMDRYDSLVLRPGSLFKHGEYYYLFFEAAGKRLKFEPDEGGFQVGGDFVAMDTIGLARSKNLIDWQRHPWNPAIPARADFDGCWTAWPVAVPRDDSVYVYYAASPGIGYGDTAMTLSTGLIKFDYKELENWGNTEKD